MAGRNRYIRQRSDRKMKGKGKGQQSEEYYQTQVRGD